MELPKLYKNKIDIEENKQYYRSKIKKEETLPLKIRYLYNNKEYIGTIKNQTENYYILKEGKVFYKKDINIIEKY